MATVRVLGTEEGTDMEEAMAICLIMADTMETREAVALAMEDFVRFFITNMYMTRALKLFGKLTMVKEIPS